MGSDILLLDASKCEQVTVFRLLPSIYLLVFFTVICRFGAILNKRSPLIQIMGQSKEEDGNNPSSHVLYSKY